MKLRLIKLCTLLLVLGSIDLQAQNKRYDLKATLQTAKINNPILKAQFLNIGISETNVITAGLRPNPALNNQTLQLGNNNYFVPNTNWNNSRNRQVWWQLTKPFQWPGQRSLKISTSKQEVKLTQSEYEESERNILLDVSLQWLSVWTAHKKLDMLLMAKSNMDSLNRINQLRFQKQVITETDLLRTELLVQQFDLEIKLSKQELFVETKNLKFLLGIEDSIVIDTSDNFKYYSIPQVDSLIEVASMQRADLVAAQNSIDLMSSNIQLQRRLAYPVPDLGVIYNPQNSIPYFGIFATAQIPIFSRNQGQIRKSYLEKQQAEQILNNLNVLMKTEVNNAYGNFQVRKNNIAGFESILKRSQQILENVKYSYLRGGTTIIDFLEAQRSWLETRKLYYDELEQYKGSYIQLLYTTGLINQLAL